MGPDGETRGGNTHTVRHIGHCSLHKRESQRHIRACPPCVSSSGLSLYTRRARGRRTSIAQTPARASLAAHAMFDDRSTIGLTARSRGGGRKSWHRCPQALRRVASAPAAVGASLSIQGEFREGSETVPRRSAATPAPALPPVGTGASSSPHTSLRLGEAQACHAAFSEPSRNSPWERRNRVTLTNVPALWRR